MLTGQKAPGFELPSEICPGLNPAWDGWIKQALAQRVERRFASAEAMAQAMPSGEAAMLGRGSQVADGKGSAGASGAAPDGEPQTGKKGLWLWLAAVLVVGAVLTVGLLLKHGEHGDPALQQPRRLDQQRVSSSVTGNDSPASLFTLRVEPAEADARVWLGNRTNVPVVDGELSLEGLPAGEHELIVQVAGFEPLTTKVSIGEDGGGEQRVRLVAVKGRLRVTSDVGTSVTAISASGRRLPWGRLMPPGTCWWTVCCRWVLTSCAWKSRSMRARFWKMWS